MTKNLDNEGLRAIAENYDLFYIDLWGVVHNGIKLHEKAIFVLKELSKLNKKFILLTNAPRPNEAVKIFLEKMGMDNELRDHVFTSGEASLNYLKRFHNLDKFFHIGPPRDFDLFKDFRNNQSKDLNDCQYLLCSGLFDEHDDDLNYYKDLLEKHINIKLICTNPDLIVDRGNKRELCAGSVAKIFEKLGGKVDYFGKPYPLVYQQSANTKNKKVLCIGDNLNTDIKGANLQNFKSLFILNGIHKDTKDLKKLLSNYNVKVDYIQSQLKW